MAGSRVSTDSKPAATRGTRVVTSATGRPPAAGAGRHRAARQHQQRAQLLAAHHQRLQPFAAQPGRQARGQHAAPPAAGPQGRHPLLAGQVQPAPQGLDGPLGMGAGLDRTAAPVEQHHRILAVGRPAAQRMVQQAVAALHLDHGQPGLDAAGGVDHEGQALPVVGGRQAGDIEAAQQLAVERVAHHRGRAGPALDAGAEVLGRVDLGRPLAASAVPIALVPQATSLQVTPGTRAMAWAASSAGWSPSVTRMVPWASLRAISMPVSAR
jgi:hypothetical protein